eukprot:5099652-Amphidinium_carterae.3
MTDSTIVVDVGQDGIATACLTDAQKMILLKEIQRICPDCEPHFELVEDGTDINSAHVQAACTAEQPMGGQQHATAGQSDSCPWVKLFDRCTAKLKEKFPEHAMLFELQRLRDMVSSGGADSAVFVDEIQTLTQGVATQYEPGAEQQAASQVATILNRALHKPYMWKNSSQHGAPATPQNRTQGGRRMRLPPDRLAKHVKANPTTGPVGMSSSSSSSRSSSSSSSDSSVDKATTVGSDAT